MVKLDGMEVEIGALTRMISLAFESLWSGVLMVRKTEELLFVEFY